MASTGLQRQTAFQNMGPICFLRTLKAAMYYSSMDIAISQSASFWRPQRFWEADTYKHYKCPFYRWENWGSKRIKYIYFLFCVRPLIFMILFHPHNRPMLYIYSSLIHSFILQMSLEDLCRYKQWTKSTNQTTSSSFMELPWGCFIPIFTAKEAGGDRHSITHSRSEGNGMRLALTMSASRLSSPSQVAAGCTPSGLYSCLG